jgi:hypothetical protein
VTWAECGTQFIIRYGIFAMLYCFCLVGMGVSVGNLAAVLAGIGLPLAHISVPAIPVTFPIGVISWFFFAILARINFEEGRTILYAIKYAINNSISMWMNGGILEFRKKEKKAEEAQSQEQDRAEKAAEAQSQAQAQEEAEKEAGAGALAAAKDRAEDRQKVRARALPSTGFLLSQRYLPPSAGHPPLAHLQGHQRSAFRYQRSPARGCRPLDEEPLAPVC